MSSPPLRDTSSPHPVIRHRSDFDVVLVDTMGDDRRIVQAAQVSLKGAESLESAESERLIAFLMSSRHGSPFESCVMQWMISAPIFVWREFHRHRIASYSEESSRWKQLDPVFYVPPVTRPTFKVEGSRTGDYRNVMAQGANQIEAQHFFVGDLRLCQTQAYEAYDFAVNSLDIAKEVARQLLPVSIYSTCYVTMNLRALMNFLSLRTDLTALWEIRQVAQAMERQFASAFPQVHRAWDANGRIAP